MLRAIAYVVFLFVANVTPSISLAEESFSPSENLIVKTESKIWLATKNNDIREFDSNCKAKQSSICVLGSFLLGKTVAKTFLNEIKGDQQFVRKAVINDELVTRHFYQTKITNPFGSSGYVFTILDLVYALSSLYPSESVAALISWYKFSEGEYAEFAKEKLIWIFQGKLNNDVKRKLLKQYEKDLSEIEEIERM